MTEKHPSHKPVTITRSIEDDVDFFGDRTALSRAIAAVVENSMKYNNENEIRVEVQLTKVNDTITLRISDNGVGLGSGDLKAVFNRFYRVGQELQREHSGTGLGLYLCREIIRAHGGEIAASSEGPGKGTTFTITMKANKYENDSSR